MNTLLSYSLRKQMTFYNATTGFPTKWGLRNECRNSILMIHHYPDLSSASDWSCCVGNLIQPIRSTTQISVVTRHHYGISALVPQTSLRVETSAGVAKCRLFCQAILHSAQRSRAHPAQPNHPLWSWPVTSKPGRVPLRVLGRGVPSGSPNPEPIQTQ